MPNTKPSRTETLELEVAEAECEDKVIDAACDLCHVGVTSGALIELLRAVQELEAVRARVERGHKK